MFYLFYFLFVDFAVLLLFSCFFSFIIFDRVLFYCDFVVYVLFIFVSSSSCFFLLSLVYSSILCGYFFFYFFSQFLPLHGNTRQTASMKHFHSTLVFYNELYETIGLQVFFIVVVVVVYLMFIAVNFPSVLDRFVTFLVVFHNFFFLQFFCCCSNS